MTTAQLDRNAALIALVKSGVTLAEAGKRFGITRERARQIWRRAFPSEPSGYGIRKALRPPVPCSQCGKAPTWGRHAFPNNTCGPCKKESHKKIITCIVCGGTRTIYGQAHALRSPELFCGRRCQGKWLGTHYGRGRPGNPGPKGQRKAFCLRGHLRSGDNLYVSPKGARSCRACHKVREARYLLRRRAGLASAEFSGRGHREPPEPLEALSQGPLARLVKCPRSSWPAASNPPGSRVADYKGRRTLRVLEGSSDLPASKE